MKLLSDTLARASNIKCVVGVVCSNQEDVEYIMKWFQDFKGVSVGTVMVPSVQLVRPNCSRLKYRVWVGKCCWTRPENFASEF